MQDLKKNVKELEKKLDQNVELILNNMNRLHEHEELINKNTSKIKQNSYALEILQDYKEDKRRLYKLLTITTLVWLITLACLIFVLMKG